ncbi:MAG: hypothetical protein IPM45_12095 [Acidimicrobiales bacterium]|nr:hypothetical protein [Acidimicrobiales bacterium]
MPLRPLLARVAGLLALVVALAACRVDVQVDLDVAEDGSGTATVAVAADQEILDGAPGLLDQLRFDDLQAAGWVVEGPAALPDGGAVVLLSKPFASAAELPAVLGELNGPAGPLRDVSLTVEHPWARTRWELRADVGVDGAVDAFTDAELVAALGAPPLEEAMAGRSLDDVLGLTVRVSLPGEVSATTPDLEGGTATWTPVLGSGGATTLEASAQEWRRATVVWTGVAAAAVLALLVVLLVRLVRALRPKGRHARRRARRAEAASPEEPPPEEPPPEEPPPEEPPPEAG